MTTKPVHGAGAYVGLAALWTLVAALSACNTDTLRTLPEPVTVSVGGPQVSPDVDGVSYGNGGSAGNFAPTTPLQCDSFLQSELSKVDILWVIDDSGSMGPKQQRIQTDFQTFMTELQTPDQNGNVPDYHIGVVTTDMFNATQSGRLQNSANLPQPWIGTDTCPPPCDPVAMFKTNSNVGTSGAGVPKGMLAAVSALTPPLSTGPNAGFLRDDANLIILFVTDAEDTSCAPVNQDPFTYGCVEPLTYGEVSYYTQLFLGLKGFGYEDMVKIYSFVGTTNQVVVPDSNGQIMGCEVQGVDAGSLPDQSFAYAWYAPRYIELATNVTGADGPQDICNGSFNAPFQVIASPLQSDFYLSRTPTNPSSIECTVTQNGTTTISSSTDFTYDASGDAVAYSQDPPAGSVVKCCYSAM